MSVQESLPGAMSTLDFFRKLYPEGVAPHYILIFTITNGSMRSHWFGSIERAADFAAKCAEDAIYCGVGLSPKDYGPYNRCEAKDIAVLPALVCDLDIAGAAHTKLGLPPNKDDARRIFPPNYPPTVIVDSGHGLHGWWQFKEPWALNSDEKRQQAAALSQRWHRYLSEEAKRLGYVMDSVFDLARVLRLVGTTNRKVAGDPRVAQVIEESGRHYDPSDIEAILDMLGVPEVEVKSVDEQGRIELGHLHVNPRVELTPELDQKLQAVLFNDPDFAAVWHRKKKMPRDNSWSGVAQSITNTLALAGFSNQEIIDLLAFHRREHGDPGKRTPKPLSWFMLTIGKARTWATEQQERDRKRAKREANEKEEEQREATESALIAEASKGHADARKVLFNNLEIDVRRLVQIGDDVEPAYRLELADDRVVHIPSLAAMTSFAALNRYVWRYLKTALPGKAKKQWRAISIALAKLVELEDTGLGGVEVLINDLGEYFSHAHGAFFEEFPAAKYTEGPPPDRYCSAFSFDGLVHAADDDEFRVGLKLLALPQGDRRAAVGVYFLDPENKSDIGGEIARVIFKLPPLYNWLRKHRERKYEAEELTKRLAAAGFEYRQTASESGVRLKRVWRGTLADGAVDDHKFLLPEERMNDDVTARLATDRVQ